MLLSFAPPMPLPRPGVLHGAYPQRPDAPPPRWLAALATAWRLLPRPGECLGTRRFLQAVQQATAVLAALPEPGRIARLQAVRATLARQGLAAAVLPEALALAADAAQRQLGLVPHAVQLLAARTMLQGRLAEMATGEGKTLAAFLAAAVAGLAGVPVHLVTANDYLVQRDAAWLQPAYAALGLSVGTVVQPDGPVQRMAAHRCHVTYCTARELVFDWLRDQLARRGATTDLQLRAATGLPLLLRGLCCAFIDEADAILLDDAMTPLVLSHSLPDEDELARCRAAWRISGLLGARRDYRLHTAERSAELTEAGSAAVAAHLQRLGVAPAARRQTTDAVRLALAARHLYQRDRHYLVRDGKLLLIDETTGRVAEGRVWSRGLQALVELKEGCKPSGSSRTLTQTTFQRFFPRYLLLGGMSGTLNESRAELATAYGLALRRIPLRRPSRRLHRPTRLHATDAARWTGVVAEAQRLHAAGLPVLLATDSVADSERASALLTRAGLPHEVLNARHDAAEAAIVARAGQAGAITVATNMAGRGTDIAVPADVAAAGGLQVLACQHNPARRLDRQLAGRCARQGQPGAVQRWLALDAGLFLLHPRLARAAAALCRRLPGAVVQGPLADLLAALPQRLAERHDAGRRAALRQDDRTTCEQLGFAGPAD